MRAVCKHIQEHYEDDTKALNLVIKIIHTTLFSWGVSSSDLDTRWKTYHLVKKATENKLDKSKRHIRVTLIDRVMLQHELRLKNLVKGNFTTLHAELLQDILALSVSHYSGVRMAAQDTLFTFFKNFNCSHFLVLPKICEILSKNNESTHEELKGALHILLGKKEISMISIPEWDLLNELWLALVNSQYSEKASIITLMSKINETVQKDADGHWVNHFISKSCKETAKKAWSEGIKPLCECPSNEQIKESEEICEKRNEINLDNYNRLVKGLSRVIDDRQLHWRKIHLAFDFLCLIIRGDVRFPKEGVQTIVKNLNSETLSIRKSSINGLAAILKQQKRTHPKFKFNPIEHQMEDNQWLQYRSDIDYCRAEIWYNTIFVEKNYIGFYAWPKDGIDVYEPEWKQPNINRALDELDDEEKPIFEFFTNQTSVDTLFSFLSLEDRKGHDEFSAKRFQMFKGLFRNFGPTFLPKFKEKILSFVSDPHESKQRCAAEVIAGLVRGSKHWPLKDIIELKHYLEPLIESMLSTMTTETFRDWGTCVTTCFKNRDGRKLSWFVKLLVEDPLQSKQMCLANETTATSFLQASRIYCILCVVVHQSWRALNLVHSLLEYLKDKDHLTNAYENVRERIGFLLCRIFVYDVNVPCLPNTLSLAPKRAQFIEHILPKVMKAIKRLNPSTDNSSQLGSLLLSPEQKQATNLLEIVCRWIMFDFYNCPISIASDFFRLLPILCEIQSETQDDGIVPETYRAIIFLSHAMLTNESLKIAVNTCKEMMTNKSWHTRSALTEFLECLVSSNLFIIMNDEKLRDEISEIVLALLEDESVEVRKFAAHTLSSLVHCEFIKVNDALIERFERKCRKAIRKYRNCCQFTTTYDSSDLLERHSGVLGLCAIVNAYPYDVPEMLPKILMLLANHANDPQPISGAIVKTLSNFRRTHQDGWRYHKLKFSEDQLSVITDLLVSPSYYA
ncbi:proteasome activator complex subunit-like protein [Dinothrombium tinctorium]|uniref:Proteasome activator complex subunit-like protein n=1 Tax=Dinothrombium tinctorium TaxID=1965070 RepID=A0A3S3RMJ9_9ACAR|nr:proteasome activator complex subunit-like protein [Dinothrombium tinctorium]